MKQLWKSFFILLFAGGFLSLKVLAQERIVCDNTCETGKETAQTASTKGMGFAVVSPIGRSTVAPIQQAPRLGSLNGKTIAVVGMSFMSRVTHPEIKRLIKEHYPDARVLRLTRWVQQDHILRQA